MCQLEPRKRITICIHKLVVALETHHRYGCTSDTKNNNKACRFVIYEIIITRKLNAYQNLKIPERRLHLLKLEPCLGRHRILLTLQKKYRNKVAITLNSSFAFQFPYAPDIPHDNAKYKNVYIKVNKIINK